jgi:hypothetical protein
VYSLISNDQISRQGLERVGSERSQKESFGAENKDGGEDVWSSGEDGG